MCDIYQNTNENIIYIPGTIGADFRLNETAANMHTQHKVSYTY